MTPDHYIHFFENLRHDTPIEAYHKVFHDDIIFRDPFHTITGVDALHQLFMNMFHQLHEPRFVILETSHKGHVIYFQWRFYYRFKPQGDLQEFTGVSRVEFHSSGHAISHVDYWDAATHVYEYFPLLGPLLRFVKRRIQSTPR